MPNRRDHSRKLQSFARHLRRVPSDVERRMWSHRRNRRLAGFKFRRQHPVHGYIVDYVCLEEMLIVELDGSQHFEPDAEQYDEHRNCELLRVGFRTLRFQADVVMKRIDDVLKTILDEPKTPHARLNPHPSPLPQAGEGARTQAAERAR